MRWLSVAILFLASVRTSAAQSTGAIEGIVTDAGKPVAGALVAAVEPQSPQPTALTRSDAQGVFRFAALAPTKYGVTATAEGHTAGLTLGIAVSTGKTARADVKLGGESIILSGTIVDDATGHPAKNAKVAAGRESEADGDLFAVDVHDGHFRALLPRARYGVTVTAPGYADERRGIPANSTDLTLRMTRSWPSGPAPSAVVDWLRTHAVPLKTVDPEHGFEDLAPLAASIGDARIVGLGEATHGTHEFFRLKHRLLEWLVAERGFNVFALEASMPESFDVNQYVLTGRGDPQKALATLSGWTWDTEETLDLIRWMRRWNEDPKHKKVKFYGFDMQSAPRPVKVVLEYVARVAPQEATALTAPLLPLRRAIDAEASASWPTDDKQRVTQAASALLERFDSARAEWSARSSPDEWAVARQHARILVQFLREWLADPSSQGELRDEAGAENVGWILDHEGPESKIVIWAHDGHVAHGSHDPSWRPMGLHLTRTWGKAYVVVGLGFGHGSFHARDLDDNYRLRSFTVGPLPAGSFDATLHAVGVPLLVIDLRSPATGIVADWLAVKHAKRDFGATFSDKWPPLVPANPNVIPHEFDLVAFVDETSAAHDLPEGSGGDATVLPTPVNLDFEVHNGSLVSNWKVSPQSAAFGWAVESSRDHPFQGRRCASIHRLPGVHYGEKDGLFIEQVSAVPFRGKRIRLTGAVRANVHDADSSARLLLRVNNGPIPGPANSMREQPIVDPHWRAYSIELEIPSNAVKIDIGGAVVGDGSACFDNFKLGIVSEPTP
jgi:erythromycin esterase